MKLDKAKADIRVSRMLLSSENNPTNDEGLYDLAAYHAQQAVEKTLKHVLHDKYGMDDSARSFRIHDIADLIQMVEEHASESGAVVTIPDMIKLTAAEISAWEANSRYGDNLVVVREDIARTLDLCEQMIAEIES